MVALPDTTRAELGALWLLHQHLIRILPPSVCQPCVPRRSPGSDLRFFPPGVAPSNWSPTFPATNSQPSRPCCPSKWLSEGPGGAPTDLGNTDQTGLSWGVKLLPMLSSLRSLLCPHGCQTRTSSKPQPNPLHLKLGQVHPGLGLDQFCTFPPCFPWSPWPC